VSRRRLNEVNVRCAYAALNEMVEPLWPLPAPFLPNSLTLLTMLVTRSEVLAFFAEA
jgi:hypothetical protein